MIEWREKKEKKFKRSALGKAIAFPKRSKKAIAFPKRSKKAIAFPKENARAFLCFRRKGKLSQKAQNKKKSAPAKKMG